MSSFKKLSQEKRNIVLNNEIFLLNFANYIDGADIDYFKYEDIKDNEMLIELIQSSTLSKIVDSYLERTHDVTIIKNTLLLKKTFGKNLDELLKVIDLDDVIKLINTSIEKSSDNRVYTEDILAFLSLVASLGQDAQEVLSFGKIDLNIKDVIDFKDKMVVYSMNKYRRENAEVLDNVFTNVLGALEAVTVEDLNSKIGLPRILTIISENDDSSMIFDVLIDIKNGIDRKKELYEICEKYKRTLLVRQETKESNRILGVLTSNFELTDTGRRILSDKINKEHLVQRKRNIVLERIKNETIDSKFKMEVSELLEEYRIGDFDTFVILMMDPVISGRTFEKATYLSFFGYDKPKNYGYFLSDQKKMHTVNTSYNAVKKSLNGLPSDIVRKAIDYLTGKTEDFDEKINPTIITTLKREKHALEGINISINENGELIYIPLGDKYNTEECEEYRNKEFVIERLNKMIYKYVNSVEIREFSVPQAQLDEEITKRQRELPLTETNFKIKSNYFSPHEIGHLFSGFDFTTFIENNKSKKELVEFLIKNKRIIKMLSSSLDESYIPGIGVALSNFSRIQKICKWFDIDMETLDIVDFKRIYDNISVNLNSFDLDIDRTIVRKICENDRYSFYKNPSERMERASNLMQDAMRKKEKSIPIITSKSFETIDSHDPRVLVSGIDTDACYRIGGNAHNILHYCVLDKNGVTVLFKDSLGRNVGRAFGVRRGNGLFMHQLQKSVNTPEVTSEELTSYLKEYADEIIKVSALSDEPIEFVSITDCADVKLDDSSPELTPDKCPYITFPIDTNTRDYQEFLKYPGLKEDSVKPIYTNYFESKTRIVRSAKPLEKLEIKDYDALPLYIRKRTKAVTYHIHNVEEYKSAKIKFEKILYLYNKDNDPMSLDISTLETITFGEDWFCAMTKDGEEIIVDLRYDDRSRDEIEGVRKSYGRSNSQML